MNPIENFKTECEKEISQQGEDKIFKKLTSEWVEYANSLKYSYHFSWLSRPVIQYPQDIVAIQELIWKIKPDLIIETGVAHGGSLILSASILAMLDYSEAIAEEKHLDVNKSKRRVIGIDIDIRQHNRKEIELHPFSKYITLIEGSSTSTEVVSKVSTLARGYSKIMVFLDSNHTHEHVLAELEAYSNLVTKDSYCVVFDTIIEDLKNGAAPERFWDKGNNPKTAVWEFLKTHPEYIIDQNIDNKLMISVAPEGYLKKIK